MKLKSALHHRVQAIRTRLTQEQLDGAGPAAGSEASLSEALDELNHVVDELLAENDNLSEKLSLTQTAEITEQPAEAPEDKSEVLPGTQQQHLLVAAEAAELGIWYWDLIRNEPICTDWCKQLLGLPSDTKITYSRVLNSLHTEDRRRIDEAVKKALETRQALDIEYRVVWPDGSLHWLHAKGRSFYDANGQPVSLLGTVSDVTQYKAEQEEMLRRADLIELQHHLMHSRELERMKIANDLHEGLLQVMIGIQLSLEDALEIDEKDKRMASMRAVQENLREEVRSLRDYCNELRPPTLMPLGLEKAIRSHIENLQDKYPNLVVDLDLEPDQQYLSPDMRLALFRIYQELINNVARHAGATQVSVRLSIGEAEIMMEVKDNGRGFELPLDWLEVARKGHLGLVSVQERVEAMHGTLKISTQAGQGTLSQVRVPLTDEDRTSPKKSV